MKFARLVNYIVAAAGTTGLVKAPALAARKRALKVFLAAGRRYTFPATDKPRASFIIPFTMVPIIHWLVYCRY